MCSSSINKRRSKRLSQLLTDVPRVSVSGNADQNINSDDAQPICLHSNIISSGKSSFHKTPVVYILIMILQLSKFLRAHPYLILSISLMWIMAVLINDASISHVILLHNYAWNTLFSLRQEDFFIAASTLISAWRQCESMILCAHDAVWELVMWSCLARKVVLR